jgi:hypothetical protein
MDLDTMLADVAPARHVTLEGPGSPAAVGLYQRITAAPPPAVRAPRRTRFPVLALLTAAAAGLAAAVTLALIPGGPAAGPHTSGSGKAQLAAWSVTRQPGGLVLVTIRELRDPMGLRRMLRADGVPANVRFVPHDFMATTSPSATPRACRLPHMSNRANALLQGRIMPLPFTAQAPARAGHSHLPRGAKLSWGLFKNGLPSAVLVIRPSAIPHGIGLFIKAWAVTPGTHNGPYLSMDTGLVQVSPQCTGTYP